MNIIAAARDLIDARPCMLPSSIPKQHHPFPIYTEQVDCAFAPTPEPDVAPLLACLIRRCTPSSYNAALL